MNLKRREFFGTALAAGAAAMAAPTMIRAQDEPPARSGRGNAAPPPTYTPKVEKLFKSPDRYPNALEATPEGLWVADQVSERVNLLDFRIGKVLRFGREKATISLDLYNAMNADSILTYNQNFIPGGTWLQANSILTGRLARISAEFSW